MKIKYLIDTILSPKIQVLDFVDRYAGIVRTINIAEGNGTETGIVKRYPLACNVTGVDCANIGVYQNLVPDDTKKSVIYWEMISPMTNGGMTKTRDFYRKKFKGTARLVVWLNLAKLGIDNCTDSILVLPILEKEITTKGKITGGIYDGDLLWIEPLRMVNQDINTIFGKYDYNKLKNYYLYPFDFFAIDVQFTLEQCLSRGGLWPCALPIDCPNDPIPVCKSLDLDGVNEYIDCTNNSVFDINKNTPFTFSCNVKFPNLTGPKMIFSKYDNVSLKGVWFGVVGDKIRLTFATSVINAIIVQTTESININTWYNLTVKFDGSANGAGINFYIDGIETALNTIFYATTGGDQLNTSSFIIGGNLFYSNMLISAAKMWNIELSNTEILNYANCNINVPKESDLILNTDIGNALWNGSEFNITDLTGITTGYTSVNSEEIDLLTDCP